MKIRNTTLVALLILFCGLIPNCFAIENTQTKYPDYSYIYLGKDKHEKFNRKMFNFNLKMYKGVVKPVTKVYTSIIPKYGIERIASVTNNLAYPKRLISSLTQKDFKSSKIETQRFLTNSTIGLLGMYDPAKSWLHIEPTQIKGMEQSLSKRNVKKGNYLVLPFISSTNTRGIYGSLLDTVITPTTYVPGYAALGAKATMAVNGASYMYGAVKMVESNYADPYDIAKKVYAIDNYINNEKRNYTASNSQSDISQHKENTEIEESNFKEDFIVDVNLRNYNPNDPVTDSLRTALLDNPEIRKSKWAESSIWNRSFSNRIKTSSVNIYPDRKNYKFRYILQKDKNAPLAIVYPSIGEGITSSHSDVFAKMFYDEGYSVIIQGSYFQWEFVQSMPQNYRPGLPKEDIKNLRLVTSKIIDKLEKKHNRKFSQKTVIGTSLGAYSTLYLANMEYKHNTLDIDKYIAICPPVDLMYAIRQFDGNLVEWENTPEFRETASNIFAKAIQLMAMSGSEDLGNIEVPINSKEAKMITNFIMHQKLSDLIFTIEKDNASKGLEKTKEANLYRHIDNMNYEDYMKKYVLTNPKMKKDDFTSSSLYSMSDYFKNSNNYVIYHAADDYLISKEQLNFLKTLAGDKMTIFSNGAHLGFTYRKEFLYRLKNEIRKTTI